mmetsp:Transcript_40675/g.99946  ORF Transcript_40675/g.99946 Transcript_40675/m.99946 type:complete len:430 (+) Transcript_40675:37-1326(+)
MSSPSAGGGKPGRNVKKGYELDQKRRVRDAMERQKSARKGRLDLARRLGGEPDGDQPAEPDPNNGVHAAAEPADGMHDGGAEHSPGHSPGQGGRRGGKRSEEWDKDLDKYKGQLMMPEWMIASPDALRDRWLVCPRPEGKRCLVIASGGKTVSRLRDGRIFQTFSSHLPNGCKGGVRGRMGGSDFSILDCIFVQATGAYYICDVMCWKGHSVYECTSEFRLFWLQQKLAEDAPTAATHNASSNPHPIIPIPWFPADAQGLEASYCAMQTPYQRDGLHFLHREAHYELGATSLSLVWKDAQSSTYLSEMYEGLDPAIQVTCLRLDGSGQLLTSDSPSVVVARGTPEQLAGVQTNKSGFALFKISGVEIEYADESLSGGPTVTVGAMEFYAPAAAKRMDADPLSKILFQQSLRGQPLSFQEIVAAASAMND